MVVRRPTTVDANGRRRTTSSRGAARDDRRDEGTHADVDGGAKAAWPSGSSAAAPVRSSRMPPRMRLALVLPLSLCAACAWPVIAMSRSVLQARAAEVNAGGPSLDVAAPVQLATVRRVAVMEFRDLSFRDDKDVVYPDHPLEGRMLYNHPAAGLIFAEHFEEQLLKGGVVEVAERGRMAAVLHEQALQQTGVTDGPLPEIVAGTAGADAVLLGTITQGLVYQPNDPAVPYFTTFAVHVRLVDTRDGRILAFGHDTILDVAQLPDVQATIRAVAQRLGTALGDAIADARRAHPRAQAPEREEYMKAKGEVPATTSE